MTLQNLRISPASVSNISYVWKPHTVTSFTVTDKSIQSAGGAGVWRADGAGTPWVQWRRKKWIYWLSWRYFNVFLSTWALLAAGLVFAFPMIYLRVKDSTEYQDEVLSVQLAFTATTTNAPLQGANGWPRTHYHLGSIKDSILQRQRLGLYQYIPW